MLTSAVAVPVCTPLFAAIYFIEGSHSDGGRGNLKSFNLPFLDDSSY